jgi:outer membrane receptor protein involved in Fe transport
MGYRELRNALVVSVAASAAIAVPAQAQTRSFNVPAQAAATAIPELARQADIQILVSEAAVRGKVAKAVRGQMSVEQALRRLLSGTGLHVQTSDGRTITLAPEATLGATAKSSSTSRDSDTQSADGTTVADDQRDIVVTGTHIKGVPPASPVVTLSQSQIRERGYNDLGAAVRSLPSNFNGGQNPTVTYSAGGSPNNNNTNGASTLNLRGLGPDATLTLLNGHRYSYNGTIQGVDISAIPLAAVDRLEIVPDGASAVYGSDAVGGVANVILKRDFSGIDTSARVGGSTDGGNFQQQYTLVTGGRWDSGGIIVAGDYSRATPIDATNRSYTSGLFPSATITPGYTDKSVIVSGHQDIIGGVTFQGDALYNVRDSRISLPYSSNDPASVYGTAGTSAERTFAVSPAIKFSFVRSWTGTITGTYSYDHTRNVDSVANPGSPDDIGVTEIDNKYRGVDFSAEGPLFTLPGGPVRLAFGAGYRENSIHFYESDGASIGDQSLSLNVNGSQDNEYGYGELFFPFVGSAQQIPGIKRLSLNVAYRYESYPGIGGLGRPKIGLVFEPINGLVLKGSWGKSFKAPTLDSLFEPTRIQALPASALGANPFPANANTLFLFGGNIDLKPETATTWTTTLELSPSAVPGLKVGGDYFHINYVNRIVTPIASFAGIYTNPLYHAYVDSSPSQTQVAAVLASSSVPLENETGGAFDPSTVAAIIDDRPTNVAEQKIFGVDAFLHYSRPVGTSGSQIYLAADATYLNSRQRLSALQSEQALSGLIFNPPNWRANGNVGWSNARFTINAAVNYVGGVVDNRTQPAYSVRAMTTFDLVGSIKLGQQNPFLKGITIRLSALNIFNQKPAITQESSTYLAPFDSTNYSSIGRFIGLTIDKSW